MNFRAMVALGLALAAVGSAFHVIAQDPIQPGVFGGSEFGQQLGQQIPIPSGAIRADLSNVKCIHKIEIAAQADGLIKELFVDEGSTVKKDQKILVIDSRVATAELEVAKRKLEAAEMEAEQTANIRFNEAARDLAKDAYAAEVELYEGDNTTWAEVKRKRLEAQKSVFSVDLAEVEIEKNKLAAKIAAQERDAAEVRLGLYEVIAPYDGIIVERKRDLGEWIRSGEPVLRLVNMSDMKISSFVPITGRGVDYSPNDLVGARAMVRVPINPTQNAEYDAKVDFVSPEIDSGRVRIVIRIQNQRDLNNEWILRDGMEAIVDIFPRR